jgi:hypothetical protein
MSFTSGLDELVLPPPYCRGEIPVASGVLKDAEASVLVSAWLVLPMGAHVAVRGEEAVAPDWML